jgi:hypothetical protein
MPSAADLPGEYTFLGASNGTEATGRTLVHDFEYTGTDDQQFPARLTVSVERFTETADTGSEYDAIETSLEESYGSDLAEINLTDGPTVAYLDVQVDDGDHFASVIFRDGDTVVLVLAEDTTDFDLSPLFETSRTTKQRLSE